MNFVFTALAGNQVEFFIGVGQELQRAGHAVSIVSFHEKSFPKIAKSGLKGFNIFERVREFERSGLEGEFEEICKRYSVANPSDLTIHESFGFGIANLEQLQEKFAGYTLAIESVFTEIESDYPENPVVIQETGGFTSLLAAFLVAKHRGYPHFFVEPSFFRGTVFFTRDSLYAPKISRLSAHATSQEVEKYLDDTIQAQAIVIPAKDSWQYAGVFSKLLRVRNFVRLIQKLADKYLHGLREEFSYIGPYFLRHLRMMINRLIFSRRYQEIPQQPFIYYPLHVPMDVALTVRSPDYLDQYATLDFLARNLPLGMVLAVKEHPALVGAIDRVRMSDLLRRYRRIRLLRPSYNNFEVLRKAELIVTVNSKAGAEALLLGKPVLVLGDAFYRDSPCVSYVSSLKEVASFLIGRRWKVAPDSERRAYFQAVWEKSERGELYLNSQSNFLAFSNSILRVVQKELR